MGTSIAYLNSVLNEVNKKKKALNFLNFRALL